MRLLKNLIALVALLQLGLPNLSAFSLIGPFSSWQTLELGYDPGEFGGPRLRGDEYRKTTPVMTYGVDGAFAEFFGAPGIAAISNAFTVYNRLPRASEMSEDLAEFPLVADGLNRMAQQLSAIDLKSFTMGYIMGTLGLTGPERWVWSLRARTADPVYTVANYNYDPVTGRPTRYVNGTLYSYIVRERYIGGAVAFYDAVDIPVDTFSPNISLASMVTANSTLYSDERVVARMNLEGRYYTGLTRDDAGGLRYVYRPENRNYEVAPQFSARGSGIISTGGGGSGSPWTIVWNGSIGTNTVGTGVTGTTFISAGVRAGVDKVIFIRADTEPVLRVTPAPLIIAYPETVVVNGVSVSQIVVRTNTRPDLLFSAIEGTVNAAGYPLYGFAGDPQYVNTGQLLNTSTDLVYEGPGIIEPVGGIVFNKIGPFMRNGGNSDEQDGFPGFVWGSFDGTPTPPVIYPIGTTLQELEDVVLSTRGN
jgi:hypothetical protein